MITKLLDYIRACFTGLWLQTYEPEEAEREITQLAKEQNWILVRWDIAQGWAVADQPSTEPGDPSAPLKVMNRFATTGTDQTTLIVLHNYHRFLTNPMVMQQTANALTAGKL